MVAESRSANVRIPGHVNGGFRSQIAECDSKLEAYLAVLPTRPSPGADTGAAPPGGHYREKEKTREKGTRVCPVFIQSDGGVDPCQRSQCAPR